MTKDAYHILKKAFDSKDFANLSVFPIKYYIVRNDIDYPSNLNTLINSVEHQNMLVFKNELFRVYESHVYTNILEASGAAISRINPVMYEFDYSKINQPTTITLNQNYNKNWHIYTLDNNPLPGGINYIFDISKYDSTHISANGYANSWQVDKAGKYVIFFLVQAYFSISLFIAACYGVVLVVLALLFYRKTLWR
jgi:hypothetical protein